MENGHIINTYIFPEVFQGISGLIVKDGLVYIAQDKMLTIIDLERNGITRYTHLEKDAIKELQKR